MTPKSLGIALAATLFLLLAPLAAAEGSTSSSDSGTERPDDAAWVDDCPPDHMCAFSIEPDGEPTTRGPEDCEFCRYDEGQDCIDCNTPVDDTTWGTDCPPGVYCMDGSSRPDDAAWVEDCPPDMMCALEEGAKQESGEAPVGLLAASLLALVGLLGLAAALRRRA